MLLQQLTLQNLLSFGSTPCVVPLRPLNVLIGPNGSGKSNFIEAIGLLRATPKDHSVPVRDAGGAIEWVWKGRPDQLACIEARVESESFFTSEMLEHELNFVNQSSSLVLVREQIAVSIEKLGMSRRVFANEVDDFGVGSEAVIWTKEGEIKLSDSDYDSTVSILAQRKDPQQFPEITFLSEAYERIQIFREWCFGRFTTPRLAQKATQKNDRLLEDSSNLGMMLNRLRRVSKTKRRFLEMLNQLYPNIDDFDVSVEGGTVQVFFQEGNFTIPATRLSDGTLRYLCLLVILLQPNPPPLVCVEEPELGLHPDVLPGLADLLRDASQRMQLVVTTHSDILVDALSETPEDVVICEKHDGQTTMRRLEREALSEWLKDYSLGQLWRSGQLGGNRW